MIYPTTVLMYYVMYYGAIPYVAKGGTVVADGVNLGHHLTRELTRPYHQSNCNVTTDN